MHPDSLNMGLLWIGYLKLKKALTGLELVLDYKLTLAWLQHNKYMEDKKFKVGVIL